MSASTELPIRFTDDIPCRSAADVVEQLIREHLDPAAQLFHESRGKRLVNEGPEPRVVRRVEIEDVARQLLEGARQPGVFRRLLPRECARAGLTRRSSFEDRPTT